MQRLEEDIGLAGGDVGFLYVLGVFYQHTTRSAQPRDTCGSLTRQEALSKRHP